MSRAIDKQVRRLERRSASKRGLGSAVVIHATDDADAERQRAELKASGAFENAWALIIVKGRPPSHTQQAEG
jgi:hypothetical protein